ncbi:hypothetical protein ACO0LC_04250 [Undibacterium sp. JH2W]|uniref:hypothetical protein n=1 Tax=Undibacterium sp. JH2W TaxID=3413037 RepID=UPI003BF2421F
MINKNYLLLIIASSVCCLASHARADGLADLKQALNRLQAQTPIKVQMEVKSWRKQGEGKDGEEKSGQALLQLDEGNHGLHLIYGKEILGRLEQEAAIKNKDKKNRPSTALALNELTTSDLRQMISAAPMILRYLDDAVYKGEKTDHYKGKAARMLSFEFTIDKLSERERKYFKNLESRLDIWIGADSIPIASNFHQYGTGRAFVVVNFEQRTDEETEYVVNGDRLLMVKKESKFISSGAGEKFESKLLKILQI